MYFQLERMIDDFQNQKSGPNFGPLRAVFTIFCVKKAFFLVFWPKIWPSLVKYYCQKTRFLEFSMLFCKYIEVVQALFWAVLQIWDKYVICVTRCYTSQRFCYTSQSFVTLHRVIFDSLLHFIEILLHFIELSLLDCYTSQSFVTLHRVFRPEPKLCVQMIKRRSEPKYSIFFLYGGFFHQNDK